MIELLESRPAFTLSRVSLPAASRYFLLISYPFYCPGQAAAPCLILTKFPRGLAANCRQLTRGPSRLRPGSGRSAQLRQCFTCRQGPTKVVTQRRSAAHSSTADRRAPGTDRRADARCTRQKFKCRCRLLSPYSGRPGRAVLLQDHALLAVDRRRGRPRSSVMPVQVCEVLESRRRSPAVVPL